MKGWVYVISNKAMPNLVKVGHSMKDPKARAQKLDHTGVPHPYVVEYEVLMEEPFEAEQQVHQILSPYVERKEWFCCSIEEAVDVIRKAVGNRAIYESSFEKKNTQSLFEKRNHESHFEKAARIKADRFMEVPWDSYFRELD